MERRGPDITIHKRPVGFVAYNYFDGGKIRAFRGKNVIKTLDTFIQQWTREGLVVEFTEDAKRKYNDILDGVITPKATRD